MTDQPGFQVGPHFFPFVESYKHGDPILIHEVTGLDWDTFAEMLMEASADEARPNPIVQTALLAIAVQHANPAWSRKRVSDFVRNLDLGTEEVVGGTSDSPAEGDPDADPEEVARLAVPPNGSAESSSISANGSNGREESPQERSASSSLVSSAAPGSSTTTRDFPQAE